MSAAHHVAYDNADAVFGISRYSTERPLIRFWDCLLVNILGLLEEKCVMLVKECVQSRIARCFIFAWSYHMAVISDNFNVFSYVVHSNLFKCSIKQSFIHHLFIHIFIYSLPAGSSI